jgi:hypothetical protein
MAVHYGLSDNFPICSRAFWGLFQRQSSPERRGSTLMCADSILDPALDSFDMSRSDS